MSKSIYKYPIKIIQKQKIELPIYSEILTIQTEKEIPYLWILSNINNNTKSKVKTIEMFKIGDIILYEKGSNKKYISTFQLESNQITFHVFEYIDKLDIFRYSKLVEEFYNKLVAKTANSGYIKYISTNGNECIVVNNSYEPKDDIVFLCEKRFHQTMITLHKNKN